MESFTWELRAWPLNSLHLLWHSLPMSYHFAEMVLDLATYKNLPNSSVPWSHLPSMVFSIQVCSKPRLASDRASNISWITLNSTTSRLLRKISCNWPGRMKPTFRRQSIEPRQLSRSRLLPVTAVKRLPVLTSHTAHKEYLSVKTPSLEGHEPRDLHQSARVIWPSKPASTHVGSPPFSSVQAAIETRPALECMQWE